MKILIQMDHYIFKPLRQFFMTHLRFSTVEPMRLILFVLGLNFLVLLMLANTGYLINFLAALVMIPLAALMHAMKVLDPKTLLKAKITLMTLVGESLVYIGALLYNANRGDSVFTLLCALSLMGLWLQHTLNEEHHFEIKMLPLELRYFLLALTTLLTLNFIYFLIFLVLVYGQIMVNLRLWIKK